VRTTAVKPETVRKGIVVFGHGSSVPSANDAVRSVAVEAARAGQWDLYETAFLEVSPRLDEAVARLVQAGAGEILILPYFLTLGIHLQRDLPKLVLDLEAVHQIPIHVTPPLHGHPALSAILVARALEVTA
jgi:sirohydrochlorin ferrochelatase